MILGQAIPLCKHLKVILCVFVSVCTCTSMRTLFDLLFEFVPLVANDPADEDVDIGGNEPPVSSYPPMEIEKDATYRTNKRLSPGNSSGKCGLNFYMMHWNKEVFCDCDSSWMWIFDYGIHLVRDVVYIWYMF